MSERYPGEMQDFIHYKNLVIKTFRSDKKKYPNVNEFVMMIYGNAESTKEFAMHLGMMIAFHFRMGHLVTIAAEDIEQIVFTGKMDAMKDFIQTRWH